VTVRRPGKGNQCNTLAVLRRLRLWFALPMFVLYPSTAIIRRRGRCGRNLWRGILLLASSSMPRGQPVLRGSVSCFVVSRKRYCTESYDCYSGSVLHDASHDDGSFALFACAFRHLFFRTTQRSQSTPQQSCCLVDLVTVTQSLLRRKRVDPRHRVWTLRPCC